MKTPVISIVGRSNSGKTTLLVKLIKGLAKKGYNIGTVKHTFRDFEIDYPGKDSYRHYHAGSKATAIVAPGKIAYIKRLSRPLTLEYIVKRFYKGVDLVIAEGFKEEKIVKIEVVKRGERLIFSGSRYLAAVVADKKLNDFPCPQFRRGEISRLVNYIERILLCRRKK